MKSKGNEKSPVKFYVTFNSTLHNYGHYCIPFLYYSNIQYFMFKLQNLNVLVNYTSNNITVLGNSNNLLRENVRRAF